MIEGILLENALEEILKRADRITDTKKVKDFVLQRIFMQSWTILRFQDHR